MCTVRTTRVYYTAVNIFYLSIPTFCADVITICAESIAVCKFKKCSCFCGMFQLCTQTRTSILNHAYIELEELG